MFLKIPNFEQSRYLKSFSSLGQKHFKFLNFPKTFHVFFNLSPKFEEKFENSWLL